MLNIIRLRRRLLIYAFYLSVVKFQRFYFRAHGVCLPIGNSKFRRNIRSHAYNHTAMSALRFVESPSYGAYNSRGAP